MEWVEWKREEGEPQLEKREAIWFYLGSVGSTDVEYAQGRGNEGLDI